jgi:hypothetical protein
MNKRTLFWVAALLALLNPRPSEAATATLKPLSGNTYIQHPNKELWEDVKGVQTVEEGDRIKTHNDSTAFLTLPDDHRVAIGPDSQLTLQRIGEGETKLFLKSGSIRNKVRHLQMDLGQYYKIQTPTAVCAVRGTDFSVVQNVQTQVANVHVFEGMVDLSALKKDIAAAVTHVEAGHSAMMDAGGAVQSTTQTPPPAQGNPPKPEDHPENSPKSKDDGSTSPKGPPPPGTPPAKPGTTPLGQSGPVWFDHPESISPDTFRPTTGEMPGSGKPGPMPPPLTTSFNPLSGTGLDKPQDPRDPTSPGTYTGTTGPTDLYKPPPSGDTVYQPNGLDPTQVGNQALFDTINSVGLMSKLQGLQVADLFKDGSVKMGPDGQFHLYADAIQSVGGDGVKFYNATMLPGQPGTLNYQVASIKFNQPLPLTPGGYQQATLSAFRGDYGTTMPTYYATDISNYRSNTLDYVDVQGHQGTLVLQGTGSQQRYVTDFADGRCVVNDVTLWSRNAGVYSYLGGAAPTLAGSPTPGMANSDLANKYTPTTGNPITFGRHVTYFDPTTNRIVSATSVPSTISPQNYLSGPDLVVQDTLFSSLFRKPIVFFGSSQSRIFGGMDSIVNNSDALDLLNGNLPVGMPDGLIRS